MKNKIIRFIKNKIEYLWLGIVIFISIFLNLLKIGENIRNGIAIGSTLDFSWMSDIVERLLHGYIAGRDFIFTYGPLYQLIQSIPSLILHIPSYVSIIYAPILLTVAAVALTFIIIKYTTTNKKEQILLLGYYFFFIGLASFPDPNILIRILLPFVYSLIYVNHLSIKNKFSFLRLILLLLPALFGLYVFNLYVQCLILTIVIFLYEVLIDFRKENFSINRVIYLGTLQLSVIIFSELILSILLSRNLSYLFYSLDTIRSYQFIMNIPWSFNRSLALLVFPFSMVGLLIYIYRSSWVNQNLRKILIVLVITALLELDSAFIRSDEGHMIMAVYPSIIVVFTLLFFIFKKNIGVFSFYFFILLYILIPYKSNYYTDISIQNLKSSITLLKVNKPFLDIYKLPKNYYFTEKDFKYFKSLISNTSRSTMVYPYESYILNMYNKTFNTLPLQFYEYSDSIVEEKAVEKLSKNPPQFIILGVDSKSALSLDNIPNFSRNPLISIWMLDNYSVNKNNGNYLILKFDPNKKASFLKKNDCSLYSLSLDKLMKKNIYDNLIKPPTYYLNSDKEIRLPYNSDSRSLLIFDDYNNPRKLSLLFDNKIDFKDFYIYKKNLKIIKKYQIPKFKEIYSEVFPIKCY